jgi:nucleoside-diphosphate-sugar epimerase
MHHVLVTGAFGLVGSQTVAELLTRDVRVTATDLDTPANRKAAARLRGDTRLAVDWADLTDPAAVAAMVAEIAPDAVIHLAAVIPPACYAAPRIARAVNVDGTRNLVTACERIATPPRLVLASSMAVHGPRNPHAGLGLLTPETPVAPADLYGRHKVEAEQIVRDSTLDTVVLRLGGVLGVGMSGAGRGDALHFSALLPADGRIQTVDVRDVARAFAAAVERPVTGRTFLIGGDETHRKLQHDIDEMTAAMGLEDGFPEGRPGDPAVDEAWFATDWMDTTDSQAALDFQRVSWPQLIEDVRADAGRRRYLLRMVAPILHAVLERRSPYRDAPGRYADVWAGVRAKWGDEALA